MATISEEGMQTMGEMFESGEALAEENEKAELDVLVDVINEHLDYFNEDKDFKKEVEDAVQEIEIPPKHPCPNCTKICKSKGGLTRHIRSKHTLLETNDGKDDNSASTATKPTISKAIKSNQDTLVSELYKLLSKEPEKLVDNQPTDKRWSVEQIRIAVNLLFIHLPELLVLATCKSQTSEQTKDIPEVNEREHGPLSYFPYENVL
ncbi:PREDICTED: uncharacterized protein LOC101236338 [Paramuricea clavata]|uniref:PREDICTED: uncharacterized protein LOC101236338 n=1 Tax=Paramuricea clavata TaxID=317549 RepID=A0A6S7IHM9_PARCT|nr:PREDICTED: uncharacterized protein LOC101236338 [Paramuricea clavata]